MNTTPNYQSLVNNSIRQEIQRFESVHPSIYAIYELIEHISDFQIAQQIRDHIVCIEDSFVNSQEWTISRAVNDFRIGIVGSSNSGKSALVHRYLTGSFMQEDSTEGGRFKKEISIDNRSYMLLIRDEGGAPEFQFAAWVDAIIFVFSLENETSYNAIYNYYTRMSNLRNDSEIPMLLVGTQDAISELYPRVIDDSKARKLANDLKKCSYYETCAVYGLNVDRVFQDACAKIIQQRLIKQLPATSSILRTMEPPNISDQPGSLNYRNGGQLDSSPNKTAFNNNSPVHKNSRTFTLPPKHTTSSWSGYNVCSKKISDLLKTDESIFSSGQRETKSEIPGISSPGQLPIILYDNFHQLDIMPCMTKDKEPPNLTPSSTPTASRKTRRRSNLFIPTSKKNNDDKLKTNCELGSGRKIPIKQGYLYKKSSKSLNKEWKKKYVTLCDCCLTYYPSLHDYMDDVHGKEILLHYVTVKVPGQKPRGSKSIITNSALTKKKVQTCLGISNLLMSDDKTFKEKELCEPYKDSNGRNSVNSRTSGDEVTLLNTSATTLAGSDEYVDSKTAEAQSTNVKKRHRRMKSSGIKNGDVEDQDGFEFYIVAIDNKQWQFEAANSEERNEWVALIDKEIFKSLQTNESSKSTDRNSNYIALMQSIRFKVPGNDVCTDCSAPNPEWASLNLGVLICIECSGIHRNLGSHISKIRSLGLDEWPPSHLWVMLSIGNTLANSVWEKNANGKKKPIASSSREDKEKWIKSKYESKSFLATCDFTTRSIEQQLIEAIAEADMKAVIVLLAHATNENVNCTVNTRDLRTPLHLACATGNLALSQLLIWHHANIHQVDHEGRTCLTFAKAANLEATLEAKEITISLVEFLTNLGCTDASENSILSNYRNSNHEL